MWYDSGGNLPSIPPNSTLKSISTSKSHPKCATRDKSRWSKSRFVTRSRFRPKFVFDFEFHVEKSRIGAGRTITIGGVTLHTITTDHRTVFPGSRGPGTVILRSPRPIVLNYTLKSVQNSQRSWNCMFRWYNRVPWLLDTCSNTKMCLTLNSEEFPSTGAKSTI